MTRPGDYAGPPPEHDAPPIRGPLGFELTLDPNAGAIDLGRFEFSATADDQAAVAPPIIAKRLTVSDLANPEAIERHTGLTVQQLVAQHARDVADREHTWTAANYLQMLAEDPTAQDELAIITAEAIAAALQEQLQHAGAKLVLVPACTGCGCSDDEACDPPCYWTAPDRCSACPEETA